jgi:hypothetical protein
MSPLWTLSCLTLLLSNLSKRLSDHVANRFIA